MPSRVRSLEPARASRGRRIGRSRRGFRWWAAVLAAAVAALAAPAFAQQPAPAPPAAPSAAPAPAQTPNVIVQIRVEGDTQVETGLILSNLSTRIGDPLDRNKVTRDIKAIFELGYFQDVRAYAEEIPGQGIRIMFSIVEKPRITFINLEGIHRLGTTSLDTALSVKVGSVYDQSAVDKMVENLRQEYRKKGYFTVSVNARVEKPNEREHGIVVTVLETPRVYVTDIRTQGNTVFSELDIRRFMQTAEVDCFDWINDSGVLDEEKINADLQAVTARYVSIGYIRLFIEKPDVRIKHNPEFSRVSVRLSLREGDQYFTGALDIVGDILGDKQKLLDALRLKTGDPYNPFDQNQDVFNLSQIYQEQGYAFVRVVPDARINDETKIVDVTYRITRGEKAYIGRIEIQGNRETRDYVVRREFDVRENELYNGMLLRQSQQNLSRLGYFKPGLAVDQEPTEVGNVLDMITKLDETQTGSFQAQVGYSEQTQLSLALSLSKGNLFGRGQTLRLRAESGQRGVRQNYTIDFIEPHLLDTEFSSDSSFGYRNLQDLTELNRGDYEELRLSQGFGMPIFRVFRLSFTLEGINRSFETAAIPNQRLRSFTPAFSYNTVNHPVFPSDGSEIVVSASQVGGQVLGGSTEFRRYRLRMQRFASLNENSTLVLMGRARFGWLEQVGDNAIPPEERFRLGGITTVRGYEFLDIGGPYGRLDRELNSVRVPLLDENGDPVVDSDGDPVSTSVDKRTIGLTDAELDELDGGGIFERLLNVELLFPLAGDNVRGVVFYDAGQVNAERRQYELLGESEPEFFDVKHSVGLGIRLITPLGVFRFEYGVKLKRESGETPDKFDFTISSLF